MLPEVILDEKDCPMRIYRADWTTPISSIICAGMLASAMLFCMYWMHLTWNEHRMIAVSVIGLWSLVYSLLLFALIRRYTRPVQTLTLNRGAFTLSCDTFSKTFDSSNILAVEGSTLFFGKSIVIESSGGASVVRLGQYHPKDQSRILAYFCEQFDPYLKGNRDFFLEKPAFIRSLLEWIAVWMLIVVSIGLILCDFHADNMQIIKSSIFMTTFGVIVFINVYIKQITDYQSRLKQDSQAFQSEEEGMPEPHDK